MRPRPNGSQANPTRGAAYTALKEVESDEVVPYFEDGLSDGSGPVRVLAVEGLSQSEAGRKSKKLRGALDDQAGLVKARVIKVLGKSGDPSVLPLIEAATKDDVPTVRTAAYGALVRMGRKEAWESLRQAAEAANPEDCAYALRTIADLKDQRGLLLFAGLNDGLDELHVIDVESTEGVFAFQSLGEQVASMCQWHSSVWLLICARLGADGGMIRKPPGKETTKLRR